MQYKIWHKECLQNTKCYLQGSFIWKRARLGLFLSNHKQTAGKDSIATPRVWRRNAPTANAGRPLLRWRHKEPTIGAGRPGEWRHAAVARDSVE